MFRSGQWVKFAGDIDGAHRAKDGKVVGIFVKGYRDWAGQVMPTAVVPVEQDTGLNIEVENGNLYLYPDACLDLEAVVSRDDLPRARLATADPDWQPRP